MSEAETKTTKKWKTLNIPKDIHNEFKRAVMKRSISNNTSYTLSGELVYLIEQYIKQVES